MKNTTETIKLTQDLIARFEKYGDPKQGWKHFQKKYGKEASSKYSCARIAQRIKDFDPVAAQKGFVIEEGVALALWFCPCSRLSVFKDNTLFSSSAASKRPSEQTQEKTNRDGFWIFERRNGEQVIFC